MTPQIDKQIIAIHIFPNILRCKRNQAVKFRQLIENNVGNIFFENSCRKLGRETSLCYD